MIKLGTYFGMLAEARMYESPLLARLRLAKQGCHNYPTDDMDFIMADLEQPEAIHRHAQHCTGDLTGRYFEFLAASMPHDRSDEDRMEELFWRILKCQAPFGPCRKVVPGSTTAAESKLTIAFLRYYLQTGNGKALVAARQTAEYIFPFTPADGDYGCGFGWLTEPMALLFAITGDTRCIDYCRKIEANLKKLPFENTHSHGLMSTLRGLQVAAMYTGDMSFNEQPERFRKMIQEKAVWVDGNIPETFPISRRNEGCSIADWTMLNLNAGFLTGDDQAYEKAECAMYNALSLSQLSNGRFSCRAISRDKRCYLIQTEEAWCCCAHTGGLALIKYAEHAVVLKDGVIRVNLLVPGHYEFHDHRWNIRIDITTRYPETFETLILVNGAPKNMEVKVRVPSFVRNAAVKRQELPDGICRYVLSGDMGCYLEDAGDGVALKYGPLVMAPLQYLPPSTQVDNAASFATVEGNVPDFRTDYPTIALSGKKDAAGFLVLDKEPKGLWDCFEEGPRSRLAYGNLSVNVPLLFPEGKTKVMRFYPELNRTTIMKGTYFPVVFQKMK